MNSIPISNIQNLGRQSYMNAKSLSKGGSKVQLNARILSRRRGPSEFYETTCDTFAGAGNTETLPDTQRQRSRHWHHLVAPSAGHSKCLLSIFATVCLSVILIPVDVSEHSLLLRVRGSSCHVGILNFFHVSHAFSSGRQIWAYGAYDVNIIQRF
jgi:hypothetical protein